MFDFVDLASTARMNSAVGSSMYYIMSVVTQTYKRTVLYIIQYSVHTIHRCVHIAWKCLFARFNASIYEKINLHGTRKRYLFIDKSIGNIKLAKNWQLTNLLNTVRPLINAHHLHHYLRHAFVPYLHVHTLQHLYWAVAEKLVDKVSSYSMYLTWKTFK